MNGHPTPRIFMGLTDVCGYLSGLEYGFRQLGYRASVWELQSHRFQYSQERHSPFQSFLFWLSAQLGRAEVQVVRKLWSLLCTLGKFALFAYSLFRYDTFFFIYGQTFCESHLDLVVLKRLRKRVVLIYMGTDSRPPYMNGKYSGAPKKSVQLSNAMARQIRSAEKYADLIVSHTATSQFMTRQVVRFLAVGIPVRTSKVDGASTKRGTGRLRIVHAPSNPLKGTKVFRSILDKLKAEGYEFDYVELKDRTNQEVQEELSLCDLVLDQVFSDTPMATLACEAAHFEKATVVGGYYQKQLARENPGELPPTAFCLPEQLEDTIRRLLENEKERLTIGRSAKRFVAKEWTCREVASRYIKMLTDGVPAEWLFRPEDSTYYLGWGLSKAGARDNIRAFLEAGTDDDLCLDDKKQLKTRILGFARGDGDG